MAEQQDNTTLTLSCLCAQNVFTTTVKSSDLPLEAHCCHCDSCRHASGALYTTAAPWPNHLPQNHSLASYKFSEALGIYFCPTCSTKMFWVNTADDERGFFTGALKNDPALVTFTSHIFVTDTIDGGLTPWLKGPNLPILYAGRDKGHSRELVSDWTTDAQRSEAPEQDSVPIRCKCGGVDLRLLRPNYEEHAVQPWRIDPKSGSKYIAGFCACDSCRLHLGVDLCTWIWPPFKFVAYASPAIGEFPSTKDALAEAVASKKIGLASLVSYQSTPSVTRYHCGVCSATVFYTADKRPGVLNVALGLLEAAEGARAGRWTAWNLEKIGYESDTDGGWRHDVIQGVKDSIAKNDTAGT